MEEYQQLLERAAKICLSVHAEQRDKAGKAYFMHPFRVSMNCDTDEEKIVALLHDVMEDGDINGDFLLHNGFSKSVVDAIFSLTRKEEEEYDDFVKRVAYNPLARRVKIKDIEDNLNILRLNCLNEEDLRRCNKYLAALNYLKNYKEEKNYSLNGNKKYSIKTHKTQVRIGAEKTDSLFYIDGSEWHGIGQLTTDGKIIILKNSLLRLNTTSTYAAHNTRNQIIENYCTQTDNGYVVNEDLPPMSPSTSSGLILGRSSNGKVEWKDASGNILSNYLD